jgi:hypothetical protein
MKSTAITILSLLVGTAAPSFGAPPLDDILKWLEQANGRIDVVKTEGYTHRYAWDDSASAWKITPDRCTFNCAFENKPKGRFVLDEHPSIARWISGAAPYAATWSIDFRDVDGRVIHWDRVFQQHDGAQFLGDGVILDEVYRGKASGFFETAAQQAEKLYSGLSFTGLRAIENAQVHVPDRFKDITVEDSAGGMVHVRYSSSEACRAYDFILDPKKNFALVRYTFTQDRAVTTADAEFSMTYEVLEHRQIAEGVWYPIHCTLTMKHSKEFAALLRLQHPKDDEPNVSYTPRKTELVLTKVSILDGDDAEASLTVKLPEELIVRNEGQ